MNIVSLSVPLAVLLLAAVPAAAQDATAFEGSRVEASAGLDKLNFDLARVGGAENRTHESDVGYSIGVGFDRAVSPTMLIGFDAALGFSDVGYPTEGNDALRKRREITLAGRIGTPITPNTLLYGKLGYANLQVRELDVTHDLDGVLVGAGVETKISPTAYLKGEYRYTDYADGYTSSGLMTGVGIRF